MSLQRPGIERDSRTSREFIHDGSTSGQRNYRDGQTAPASPRPGEGLMDHAARAFATGFVQDNPEMVDMARTVSQRRQQAAGAPPPPDPGRLSGVSSQQVGALYSQFRGQPSRLSPESAARLQYLMKELGHG